ncbi:MAG: hypothetical protein ACLU6Y_12430 [Ruminococcus sp.]
MTEYSGLALSPGLLVLVGRSRYRKIYPSSGRCAESGENGKFWSSTFLERNPSRQIKLRANRIGTFNENLQLLCETNLDTVREVMERKKPDVAIIDSIQTMFDEEIGSAPGSVSQVRESTNVLMQIGKDLESRFYRWSCYQGGERGWTESVGAHGRHSALF